MVHSIDTVLHAYISAALWSTNDESNENGGEPLDMNYSEESLSIETRAAMRADVERFLTLTEAGGIDTSTISDEMLGHDFWLTRGGHGCGFWDRDLGALGDLLTDICKFFGEVNLYVDGGTIYHS